MSDTRALRWLPIISALREPGIEILGVRFAGGVCLREPFVSFWSSSLGKFYCDPTHYIPMPEKPNE